MKRSIIQTEYQFPYIERQPYKKPNLLEEPLFNLSMTQDFGILKIAKKPRFGLLNFFCKAFLCFSLGCLPPRVGLQWSARPVATDLLGGRNPGFHRSLASANKNQKSLNSKGGHIPEKQTSKFKNPWKFT